MEGEEENHEELKFMSIISRRSKRPRFDNDVIFYDLFIGTPLKRTLPFAPAHDDGALI